MNWSRKEAFRKTCRLRTEEWWLGQGREGRACASLMGTCVAGADPSVPLEPRRAMPAGARDRPLENWRSPLGQCLASVSPCLEKIAWVSAENQAMMSRGGAAEMAPSQLSWLMVLFSTWTEASSRQRNSSMLASSSFRSWQCLAAVVKRHPLLLHPSGFRTLGPWQWLWWQLSARGWQTLALKTREFSGPLLPTRACRFSSPTPYSLYSSFQLSVLLLSLFLPLFFSSLAVLDLFGYPSLAAPARPLLGACFQWCCLGCLWKLRRKTTFRSLSSSTVQDPKMELRSLCLVACAFTSQKPLG